VSLRVRFAPSPTGYLHVGNARTALFNWLLARGRGGRFVLRIEDTDTGRSTAASEQSIVDDLRWLGLEWDEGPDVGGPYAPYRQSDRLERYREHAERLIATGRAYYCFCTREQLEKGRQRALIEGQAAVYGGRCRGITLDEARARLAGGETAALRFRVPAHRAVGFDDLVRGRVVFHTDVIGDPVIVRSDGWPAYNFAAVVDDATMGITHVIRGEDHVSNTPRQLLLYEALGYAAPAFAHLSLVMGPDHTPLSKRHGATSVGEFRARGILPESLVNYLALLGWSPGDDEEILPVEELARRFALEHVGRSAGVFDPAKLAWLNRHYLKVAPPARIGRLVLPFLRAAGFVGEPDPNGQAFVESLTPMIASAVDHLDQAPARLRFLFDFDPARTLADPGVWAEFEEAGARDVVAGLAAVLAGRERVRDRDDFRAVAAEVRLRTGRRGRELFHPIRVALTGAAGGPELDLAVPAIDRGAGLAETSGVTRITGCRERAGLMLAALAGG
jgi:nondiscriminating glutamyl-tRNA synthetase